MSSFAPPTESALSSEETLMKQYVRGRSTRFTSRFVAMSWLESWVLTPQSSFSAFGLRTAETSFTSNEAKC